MTSKLLNRGFLSLITTQFFGAANDNILKGALIYMVIDGAWAGQLGAGGQGIVSVCFTVPFIILSGYAGQFADRNSKRYVSVTVKVLEIPISLMGLVGFWLGNLWITLLPLIALTCQSAFFGPAKYGMIPELVPSRDLSRANGTINMMTNIAVIVGTLSAGVIADAYSPLPNVKGVAQDGMLWLPGAVMLVIAVAGLVSVLFPERGHHVAVSADLRGLPHPQAGQPRGDPARRGLLFRPIFPLSASVRQLQPTDERHSLPAPQRLSAALSPLMSIPRASRISRHLGTLNEPPIFSNSRASAPATWGAAAEVPGKPLAIEQLNEVPNETPLVLSGAQSSGLIRLSSVGPWLEKISSWLSKTHTAPTAVAPVQSAGWPTVNDDVFSSMSRQDSTKLNVSN